LMSILGMLVAHTADLRVDLARARQQSPIGDADLEILTIVSDHLRDEGTTNSLLLHRIVDEIRSRLQQFWTAESRSDAAAKERRALIDAKRSFGRRVGYEIGGWIAPTDAQPDVEALVDLMLAAGSGAVKSEPSSGTKSAEPDAYMVCLPNGEPNQLFFQMANAQLFIEGRNPGHTIEPLHRSSANELDGAFLLRHLIGMRSTIANDAYASGFSTRKAYREALLMVFDGSSLDLNSTSAERKADD
jgi:hypothetical protein